MDALTTNDRITLILAAIAFSALVVGLFANALLRLRARRHTQLLVADQLSPSGSDYAGNLSAADIAEQALSLVDTVRAENAQLRSDITALRQQASEPAKDAEPLAAQRWLTLVNERPDQVPHLAVYGPSGVGKTTLVQGIVAQRSGKLFILDPKPTPPTRRKWGGLPYLKIDRDGSYTTITAGLTTLRAELTRRLVALEDGETLEPLTVIIDEYKLLARVLKDLAPQLYIDLSDFGRELKLRLIVLSTTRSVKGLGIEGMGDTRDNFVVIEIDRHHQATMEFGTDTYTLDTAPVITFAGQSFPSDRWWAPPVVTDDADRLLSHFLEKAIAVPVPGDDALGGAESALPTYTGTHDIPGTPHADADLVHTDTADDTGGVSATLTSEAIQTLYSAGWSKNKIAAMLRGSKPKRLATIDQALAAEPEPSR